MKKNIINGFNATSNNNAMSKYNAKVWANYYSPCGDLRDSVPYESKEDAIRHITEMVEGINPLMSERMRYQRTSELEWENPAGASIEVQNTGNPVLYIKNLWVAVSANYVDLEEMPLEDWFIQFMYDLCGLDTKVLSNFAEWFYGHHFHKLFA